MRKPWRTYLIGDHVFGQADSSGTVRYLLVDGHGSTQAMTDAAGNIAKTFRYDAFGGAIGFDPATAGTEYRFGGDALYDPASGLYFHGDGVRERIGFEFIERDTYRGNTARPLTLNFRLYAGADPINYTDPAGYVFIPPTGDPLIDVVGEAADDLQQDLEDAQIGGAVGAQAAAIGADLTAQNIITGEVADTALSTTSNSLISSILETAQTIGSVFESIPKAGLSFLGQITYRGVAVIGSFPLYAALGENFGASFFSMTEAEFSSAWA